MQTRISPKSKGRVCSVHEQNVPISAHQPSKWTAFILSLVTVFSLGISAQAQNPDQKQANDEANAFKLDGVINPHFDESDVGDGSNMTGMRHMTEEEKADARKRTVKKMRLNKIGLARINQERAKKNLKPLVAGRDVDVAPIGAEAEYEQPGGENASLSTEPEPAIGAGSVGGGSLPSYVDNSTLMYFPPIRNQSGGSCAAWSGVYYNMTHEMSLAYGWDAKTGGDGYRYQPMFSYNLKNDGVDNGSWFTDHWSVSRYHGIVRWSDFSTTSTKAWCMKGDAYRSAINSRTGSSSSISVGSSLSNLKTHLNNGRTAVFACYVSSWQYATAKDDPGTTADDAFVGKGVVISESGTQGAHGMTIVGYSDDIWVDIDNDGQVDADEKGALRIANSWGTGWKEKGFTWVSYKAVANGIFWYNTVYYINPLPQQHLPKVVAKITVNHSLRNQVNLWVATGSVGATTPSTPANRSILAYGGGPYAFSGAASTPQDFTYYLDCTDITPSAGTAKRWFLGAVDAGVDDGDLTIKSFELYNVTDGVDSLVGICNQTPMVLNGETKYPYIDWTVGVIPATVSWSTTSQASVREAGTMTVTANLSKAIAQSVSVPFVVSGTATSNSDYTITSSPLTIPAGSTSATASIAIKTDTLVEEDETVILTMGMPTNALPNGTQVHTATITDDTSRFELTPNHYVSEGASSITLSVARTGAALAAVSVSYATSNGTATAGSDYTATSGTLNWAIGDSTPKTITIPITLDATAESNETFTVSLSSPTGGAVLGNQPTSTVTIYDRNILKVSATDASGAEVGRAEADGRFKIERSGATFEALTVQYAMSGTATNEIDYELLEGTVVIPAGAASVLIDVNVSDDIDPELNETAIMTLIADPMYNLGSPVAATVNIYDDEPCAVSLTVTDSDCREASSNDGTFKVTRFGNTSAAITVNYGITGTAINGTDYATLSGTVALAANANSANVNVNPTDDTLCEPTKTVVMTLSTGTGYVLDDPNNAEISIIDNDKPLISIAATDATATEVGMTTATYTVTRSNDVVRNAVTVKYATGGSARVNSDYQPLSGSVIIPAGQDTATITLTPVNDLVPEPTESVSVTIATDAVYTVSASPNNAASVSILDNEAQQIVTITATDATASEPDLAHGNGEFTVSRLGDTTAELTVNYVVSGNASNGTDYSALSGSVTIPAGSNSATITVTPSHDTISEVSETVIVNLAPGTGYVIGSYTINPTVTIRDDDASMVMVAVGDNDARELATANAGTFVISRTGLQSSALTVNYTLAGTAINGTDYNLLSGTATIAANASSATVTVTPVDDTLVEGDETVILTLSESADYAVDSQNSAALNIADGEKPIIVFDSSSDLDASEPSNNNGSFKLTRSANTAAVTVNYTISGTATSDADFTAVSGSVSFPASNNSQTVTIAVKDDELFESPESVILTLTPSSNYSITGSNEKTLTIRDNENAVTLAATDASATEGGGTGTFRFSKPLAAGAKTVNYTISGTASNGIDYTYLPGSITIPSGQTYADLTITAADDFIYDANETVILTLAANDTDYSIGTTAGQTVTITDSGKPKATVVATDPSASENPLTNGQFTVYLSKQLGSNTAITYTKSGTAISGTDYTALNGSVTINAGLLEQTITLAPIVDTSVETAESCTLKLTAGTNYDLGTSSSATVTIAADEATVYSSWAEGSFTNPLTDADMMSNPDGDQRCNMMEFAFGTDPTKTDMGALALDGSCHGEPIMRPSTEGGFELYFLRRKDTGNIGSVNYKACFTGDLTTFHESTDTPTYVADSIVNPDYEIVKVPFPASLPDGKPARFGCVKVQAAP